MSSDAITHPVGLPLRPTGPSTALRVVVLPAWRHERFVDDASASYLQLPAWARAKPDWRAESLGWVTDDHEVVGVGLVLYRSVPHTGRTLAYLPEGPLLPWSRVADDPDAWFGPLREHVRDQGAFAVRIGPRVALRRWRAPTLRAAISDPAVRSLADLPADEVEAPGLRLADALARTGWRGVDTGEGFGAGQPRFVVQLPLDGADDATLAARANQQWRRNVARAERRGVVVRQAPPVDLDVFHTLYTETAARDGFTGRPAAYFHTMSAALGDRMRLHLAELDGEALAAAITVWSPGHVWYSYGASTSRHRDVRAANALHWHLAREVRAAGASVYDLRGVSAALDEDDPTCGLVRFKAGLGGTAVEYVGEWDLVLSPLWYRAFTAAQSRRSRRR